MLKHIATDNIYNGVFLWDVTYIIKENRPNQNRKITLKHYPNI